MKRPLAMAAVILAGGILLADTVALSFWWLLGLTAILAGLAWWTEKFRETLLGAALFLIGAAAMVGDTAMFSPQDLRAVVTADAEIISIRGELLETPSLRRYESADQISEKALALVKVMALRRPQGEWLPTQGRVMTTTAGNLPANFFRGQPVEISLVLQKPLPPLAEGLFDYGKFLRRQGVFFQGTVALTNDWQLRAGAATTPPLSDRFFVWGQGALQRGLVTEDSALQLLWAMTLGWKTALTDEVTAPFMRSGTMHIFAISGLHIALIAWILFRLLRVARLPRSGCGAVVIPLLWFYTAATGWQPSAIRSTIMMTVIVLGWSWRRPVDLVNSLGAAALLILLWQPQQLFQASFQLSFSVVLSIGLLNPVFEKIRRRWTKPDEFLPDELRSRWQRALHWGINFVTTSFVTSLAAWVGSLPIVAYYFHLFTPISLLANLVIVPLSSLALAANLGGLLCVAWWPGLAEIFNLSAWFWMKAMLWFSDAFAAVPGGCFYVRSPRPAEFLFYYGVLLLPFSKWWWDRKKRYALWTLLGVTGLVCLGQQWQENQKTRVTILPVAGGEVVHVDAPGRSGDFLVDCGNASAVQFVTEPFLQAQGVNGLPRIFLTHGDVRNLGGISNLLATLPAEKLHLSPVKFRSPGYRALQKDLEAAPERWQAVQRGAVVAGWEVLHPEGDDKFPQADDGPIVLRGAIGGKKILLLSDLSRDGQKLLADRTEDLRADIVVSGLPRDSEPLGEGFLQAVRPELIIITDAVYPATERASAELQERLRGSGVPVIFCREAGAVTLEFEAEGYAVRTAWKKPSGNDEPVAP